MHELIPEALRLVEAYAFDHRPEDRDRLRDALRAIHGDGEMEGFVLALCRASGAILAELYPTGPDELYGWEMCTIDANTFNEATVNPDESGAPTAVVAVARAVTAAANGDDPTDYIAAVTTREPEQIAVLTVAMNCYTRMVYARRARQEGLL